MWRATGQTELKDDKHNTVAFCVVLDRSSHKWTVQIIRVVAVRRRSNLFSINVLIRLHVLLWEIYSSLLVCRPGVISFWHRRYDFGVDFVHVAILLLLLLLTEEQVS